MFNIEKPSLDELPSLAQLRRSTLIAGIGAALILVTVVLPAEYGVDPTGGGRIWGLTEMGKIKHELNHEAETDHQEEQGSQSFNLLDGIIDALVGKAHAQEAWRDILTFTLEPGDYIETKFAMNKGDQLQYVWTSAGGRINYDLHAHGGGQSNTYEKGRGVTEGEGNFVAPFNGEHGWFWRNRDKEAITITLNVNGDYQEIIRSE